MRRRFVTLSIASSLVVAAVVSGLLVGQAVDSGASPGSAKEVYVQTQVVERQQTAEALPNAPKHPATLPPRRTSCPVDPSAYTVGVSTPPRFNIPNLAVLADVNVVSEAVALSPDGHPYSVYFGSLKKDEEQGVIITWRGAKDPCAEGVQSYAPQRVLESVRGQPARLMLIKGDSVAFENTDGVARSFNYVTATLASGSQPPPTPAAAALTPTAPAPADLATLTPFPHVIPPPAAPATPAPGRSATPAPAQ